MSAEKATKLLLDLIGIDGAFYRLGSNKVSRFRTTPAKKKQCYKGSMAAIFISEFLCHDSLKKKKNSQLGPSPIDQNNTDPLLRWLPLKKKKPKKQKAVAHAERFLSFFFFFYKIRFALSTGDSASMPAYFFFI